DELTDNIPGFGVVIPYHVSSASPKFKTVILITVFSLIHPLGAIKTHCSIKSWLPVNIHGRYACFPIFSVCSCKTVFSVSRLGIDNGAAIRIIAGNGAFAICHEISIYLLLGSAVDRLAAGLPGRAVHPPVPVEEIVLGLAAPDYFLVPAVEKDIP